MKEQNITMQEVNAKGQTLLIVSSSEGAYDTVQLCLNLAADVTTRDHSNSTALSYAHSGGYADVEQLLLFASINRCDGDKLRNTADIMNKQKGIIQNICDELTIIGEQTK
eukprot:337693_1